ncbi:MAG TPA: hypothetical protein VHY48_01905 [Acidobacteriaceae bacterium]|jgi:hypothetical protein|nr:hypothetical protein [Acidobacteriaceae bacterium]
MQNYFCYFWEIEELFSRRRGSVLLLSTLDWALIESWREAGVPLEAVLRGIDAAFDRYETRSLRAKGRLRKVNGLAWCAQAVMEAAAEMVEAATGAVPQRAKDRVTYEVRSGFETERVASYLFRNAELITAASERMERSDAAESLNSLAQRLRELAAALQSGDAAPLEDLDRTLTVLEEQMVERMRGALPEAEMVALREQADRELAPFRSRMSTVQLRQVQRQFLMKRLLESHGLPRLSLFYMGVGE